LGGFDRTGDKRGFYVYRKILLTQPFAYLQGFRVLCAVPFAAGLPPKDFEGNPV
jgi:hypothetical protein